MKMSVILLEAASFFSPRLVAKTVVGFDACVLTETRTIVAWKPNTQLVALFFCFVLLCSGFQNT